MPPRKCERLFALFSPVRHHLPSTCERFTSTREEIGDPNSPALQARIPHIRPEVVRGRVIHKRLSSEKTDQRHRSRDKLRTCVWGPLTEILDSSISVRGPKELFSCNEHSSLAVIRSASGTNASTDVFVPRRTRYHDHALGAIGEADLFLFAVISELM